MLNLISRAAVRILGT